MYIYIYIYISIHMYIQINIYVCIYTYKLVRILNQHVNDQVPILLLLVPLCSVKRVIQEREGREILNPPIQSLERAL